MSNPAAYQPQFISRVRLPRWVLPQAWPQGPDGPALANIHLQHGRVERVEAHTSGTFLPGGSGWDVGGALALPALVDAHTHIDKTFTLPRMKNVKPGLLGAIEAMMVDRVTWTAEDVHERASRALQWAWESGVSHLRTHCDWWEPSADPIAWNVLRELSVDWTPRLKLERVSLIPLHLYADKTTAFSLAARVANSGPGALLGGFIHSTNWNPDALRHLFEAAQHHGLNVDLHADEELNPNACGLATTATLLRELNFTGHVVCGHTCALSVQDESQALRTLDAVATVPITLVTLPVTNLLLQDATTGRTPRKRGLTLLKEAKARGIPVLMASDNVQDPFCAMGSFDPLEALTIGVPAAQLDEPFDTWSEALCRSDWLSRGEPSLPLQAARVADLLLFPSADQWGFPSRTHPRVVLRGGQVLHGSVPSEWAVQNAGETL